MCHANVVNNDINMDKFCSQCNQLLKYIVKTCYETVISLTPARRLPDTPIYFVTALGANNSSEAIFMGHHQRRHITLLLLRDIVNKHLLTTNMPVWLYNTCHAMPLWCLLHHTPLWEVWQLIRVTCEAMTCSAMPFMFCFFLKTRITYDLGRFKEKIC